MADAKVRIGADITGLQAGLARSRAEVSSWGKGIAGTLSSSLGGALAAGAITAALKGLVTEFADISDAADRAGVSVRFLMSIKDDAQQTGTSLETAAKSVKKFLLELNDPKAAEKMGAVLGALGTDVDTLRAAAPEELFKVLAGAISGVGSQSDKLAILGVLLGDTGGKFEALLPLLEKVGKDGLAPVSNEMVEATKQAAALDDEFDGVVSTLKQNVLPVFINFIKVLKLAVTVILGFFGTLGGIVYEFATGAGTAIAGFAEAFWAAMTLDRAGVDAAMEKVKSSFSGKLDSMVQNAKDHAANIEAAFDDIGAPMAVQEAAQQGINKGLEDELKLLREKDKLAADAAKERKAEEEHAKGIAAWVKGQQDTLKGYEAELAAIMGKDSAAAPKSISDLNKQLGDLMALKAGGGGVIASSATQMGFGGRAVAGVQQSAVERQIAETNKLLAERKTDAAEVKALMQKLLDTLD